MFIIIAIKYNNDNNNKFYYKESQITELICIFQYLYLMFKIQYQSLTIYTVKEYQCVY